MDTSPSAASAAAPAAAGTGTAAPAASATPASSAAAAPQPDSHSAAPASDTSPAAQPAGQSGATPPAGGAQPQAQQQAQPQAQQQDGQLAPPQADTQPEDSPKGQDIAITLPESLPAHMVNQDMLKSYTDLAKELGISQEQAQKLADWNFDCVQKAQVERRQAGETYLRQLWGADFGKNMQSVQMGIATLDKHMGGDISAQLVNTGLADVPVMARIFHVLGEALVEDSMSTGTPGVGEEPPTSTLDHVVNVINKATPRQ